MRDYTELIKALRHCSGDDGDCDTCPFSEDAKACSYERMMSSAADAIEELFGIVLTYEAANDMFNPHWISVEERLPEQYNPVLVAYVGYNTNAILADMVAYRDSDSDWCWYDGDHPSGELCKVKITHWMPLPEPPKEDAE